MAASLVLLLLLLAATASDCAAQDAKTYTAPKTGRSLPAPLSNKARFKFYTAETFLSPQPYVVALGGGLAFQSVDYPREWGGGFKGYGRRSASEFGLLTVQNTIHDGGEALMGYEPRYIPCQCAGAWRRAGYALEMSFLTYDAHGHKRLDLPQLIGAYGSGMASALWYPKRDSPLVQGVQTGHMQFGFVLGFHLYQEFSPEVQRKLHLGGILKRGLDKPQ